MTEIEMWTFDRFSPGLAFGEIAVPMDGARRARWETIFGAVEGDGLPRGMLVAGMMEAYIRAIQPRPNGNVHAAQSLGSLSKELRWGDTVVFSVSCAAKQEKKGRYWVDFKVEGRCVDSVVLDGTIRSIWAA
ncbi:MAG: hypothetical protein M9944_13745 [Rhizobiaceae bacterium]|nr:hypothetical protein [Rhizobiaceae bacterium]